MTVEPLYRTFWPRFWAGFVDALVLSPLAALDYWFQKHLPSSGLQAAWFACHAMVFPVYDIYMHGRFGQTVGKRWLRVKVIDVSGAPLTMRQAFLREAINLPFLLWSVIATVSFILHGGDPTDFMTPARNGPPEGLTFGLFALELLSTLGSSQRRALHDLVAGSVVIRVGVAERLQADEELGDAEPEHESAARQPNAGEFLCSACGDPVRWGASQCRACDQEFAYVDGQPSPRS